MRESAASNSVADALLYAIQLFQGAGNGVVSNTIIMFVTDAMPPDRLANALGVTRTVLSVSAMTGYSLTTAIVDGGGRDPYSACAAAALAVATAFLFFPCYACGYAAGRRDADADAAAAAAGEDSDAAAVESPLAAVS